MIPRADLKVRFDQRGFTMVELVIVIVLVGVIAMTASILIGQAAKTYQSSDNYSAISNQGRLALEMMAREIRLLRSPADITSSCAAATTALNFTDTNGTPVTYSFAGSTLSAGGVPLADNLTAFTITYYDKSNSPTNICGSAWSIAVSLTAAQGSDSLTMRTRIHPRSF